MQGVINKTQPRVYIAPSSQNVDGVDIEAVKQSILTNYGEVKLEKARANVGLGSECSTFWTIFEIYADEIDNIYVYSSEKNLADTAIKNMNL